VLAAGGYVLMLLALAWLTAWIFGWCDVLVFRPDADDLRLIGYQLGKVATGLSLMMIVPAVVALVVGEWNAATALIAGAGICVAFGQLTEWRLATRKP
jgi:hypothetical protein